MSLRYILHDGVAKHSADKISMRGVAKLPAPWPKDTKAPFFINENGALKSS